MNTTTRDEEILRAFVASLRGETPPPNQDPAIALLVRNLVAARSDYMVKSARLSEFRLYDSYRATTPVPVGKDFAAPDPAPVAQRGALEGVVEERGEEEAGGETTLEEKLEAARVKKRALNTLAAKRSRAKAAQKLKDLKEKVKKFGGGEPSV